LPEIVEKPIVVEIKKITPREYAFDLVKEIWSEEHWYAFDRIIIKESNNWTVFDAHYPTGYTKDGVKSSAFGLGGFLNQTWIDVGCVKTEDPFIQVECTTRYIKQRYGDPIKALEFHNKNNYY